MKVTKNSAPKVPVPEGTHLALLTQIIDFGTVTDSYGSRQKIEFIWELPEVTHVFNEERGEEPFIIDRKFARNIGKKAELNKCLSGMQGKSIKEDELDIEEFHMLSCYLTIETEEDGEYQNNVITNYMPNINNKKKYKAHGNCLILDLDNFDPEVFALLPDWKQEEIKKSPEYKAAMASVKPSKRKVVVEEEEEEAPTPRKKTPAKKVVPTKKAPAKANKLFKR